MKKFGFACLLAVLAAVVALSSPAQAQVTSQKYASPGGNGTCAANSPCSLDTAIGGTKIVSCIDGGFVQDSFILSSSITIDCPGAVLTSADNDPVFQISASSSTVVILRNLIFAGAGQLGAPFISVLGGGTVIIENCRFENLANHSAIAIQFTPNSPAAQLVIRDSVFANNGIAPGTGGGLQVAPAAGGSASVVLDHVSFNFNTTAMALSGPVNVTMVNSVVSASRSNGILVGSGSTLDIEDSKLVYNVGAAVSVSSGGTVRLSNTSIKSNQIGISNSGGQALSYKNNRIVANGSTATLGTIAGGQ